MEYEEKESEFDIEDEDKEIEETKDRQEEDEEVEVTAVEAITQFISRWGFLHQQISCEKVLSSYSPDMY